MQITCKCGSNELEEIPSGENSKAYECKKCGSGIFILYSDPITEDSKK